MLLYTYKDNNKGCYENGKWMAPVVFSCLAESVLAADELFKSQIGQDARKMPNIGCSISNGEKDGHAAILST